MPDPRQKLRPRVDPRPQSPLGRATDAGGDYAELHCLSNFSFLRGASHPEELVTRAVELGYSALAITDRNSLAGVVRAHMAAKEHNLHLLIGAEVTPVDGPPLALLAPDRASYGRLARLITRGRLRQPKGECELWLNDVAELSAGLIAIAIPAPPAAQTSGSPRSPAADDAANASLRVPAWSEEAALLQYREIFEDRLALAAELAYDVPDQARLA
jgi:error-prone DNA polymerase